MHQFSTPQTLRAFSADSDHAIEWAEDEHLHAFVERCSVGLESTSDRGTGLNGPLRGVPVAVKDVIRVDGWPTRAGSLLPPAVLAGPQASVVDRLLEQGAIVAGKTVTAEFAISVPGPTVTPGTPRGHPEDPAADRPQP